MIAHPLIIVTISITVIFSVSTTDRIADLFKICVVTLFHNIIINFGIIREMLKHFLRIAVAANQVQLVSVRVSSYYFFKDACEKVH